MRRAAVIAALAAGIVAGLAAGCSPSLNWREVRVEGPGLMALFPCRPDAQARRMPLAGRPVTLTMRACEAGGATYAVSVADVGDPGTVGAALRALREASEGNLGAPAHPAPEALAVLGMTPQADSGRWRIDGHRPDGQPIRAELAVMARGTWVVQATIIGAQVPAVGMAPFFEGLSFGL